jgi:DNA polymerase III delta prime subunit
MNRPLEFEVPTPDDEWFFGNEEALQLGLAWLRSSLERLLAAQRATAPPGASDSQSGMSDLKADGLLPAPDPPLLDEDNAPSPLRMQYEAARDAMVEAGRPCALDLLSGIFGLTPFDLDVLLVALAPQIDARMGALYSYVHDRMAASLATRHLIETLLCPAPVARLFARRRLAPEAPLRRHALLTVEGPEALSPISLDERMIGFIQGHGACDPRLGGLMRELGRIPLPQTLVAKAAGLTRKIIIGGRAGAQIVGPRRSGRRAAAQAVAADMGLTAVEVELSAMPQTSAERRGRFALMAREAALSRLCLVIDAAPETHGPDDPTATQAMQGARDAIAVGGALTLVLAEDPAPGLGELPLLRLSPLTRTERLWGWSEAFANQPVEPDLLDSLVDHFPFGLNQMSEVAERMEADGLVDREALWSACRERGTGRLEGLARRVETSRGWDDLVLPKEVLADLHAVADQVGRRGIVYGRWGYDALLPHGRGVSALFAGPSGVGKTLAAEVIARELGLDLYCVDLATVVSKYIGETEKNLKRIFDAAEEAGAVLFIDEADALFGKRSEVKDSHDRYANIEISYLLQRIEQHNGLAILATNMRSHIDFGFLRRLRYLIDFPFPDFAERRILWRKAFPKQAPLLDIDLDLLAALDIAGGNIIVIATNAAFLAAAEGSAIAMRHVRQAARAEFRKLDRLLDLPALEPSAPEERRS